MSKDGPKIAHNPIIQIGKPYFQFCRIYHIYSDPLHFEWVCSCLFQSTIFFSSFGEY
uniref:Uncharacterized protein n=2 Tax=Rhizophora mucronata TaxID=61149 RepID=A0A2P2MQM7_RHIMU